MPFVSLTCNSAPRVDPGQVFITVSCILVKRRFPTSFSRVEHKSQWLAIFLANIIHRCPERYCCVGSDIDGRLTRRSMNQNMSRAMHCLSRPEVEPTPRRNIDVA